MAPTATSSADATIATAAGSVSVAGAAASPASSEGIVKFYSEQRGYGFVVSAQVDGDLFLHAHNMQKPADVKRLVPNARVSFVPKKNGGASEWEALNVCFLSMPTEVRRQPTSAEVQQLLEAAKTKRGAVDADKLVPLLKKRLAPLKPLSMTTYRATFDVFFERFNQRAADEFVLAVFRRVHDAVTTKIKSSNIPDLHSKIMTKITELQLDTDLLTKLANVLAQPSVNKMTRLLLFDLIKASQQVNAKHAERRN